MSGSGAGSGSMDQKRALPLSQIGLVHTRIPFYLVTTTVDPDAATVPSWGQSKTQRTAPVCVSSA